MFARYPLIYIFFFVSSIRFVSTTSRSTVSSRTLHKRNGHSTSPSKLRSSMRLFCSVEHLDLLLLLVVCFPRSTARHHVNSTVFISFCSIRSRTPSLVFLQSPLAYRQFGGRLMTYDVTSTSHGFLKSRTPVILCSKRRSVANTLNNFAVKHQVFLSKKTNLHVTLRLSNSTLILIA